MSIMYILCSGVWIESGNHEGVVSSSLVAENLNPESRNSEGLHAERCLVPFLVKKALGGRLRRLDADVGSRAGRG